MPSRLSGSPLPQTGGGKTMSITSRIMPTPWPISIPQKTPCNYQILFPTEIQYHSENMLYFSPIRNQQGYSNNIKRFLINLFEIYMHGLPFLTMEIRDHILRRLVSLNFPFIEFVIVKIYNPIDNPRHCK